MSHSRCNAFMLAMIVAIAAILWAGPGIAQDVAQDDGGATEPTVEQGTRARVEHPKPEPKRSPPAEEENGAVKTQGIPVVVEHHGTDPVGMRLALHLKETLQKSNLFRLSKADEKHLNLRLVTREQFAERPFLGSAYVLIWRYVESEDVLTYYLSERLNFVDSGVVLHEAEVLAEETDRVNTRFGYLLE